MSVRAKFQCNKIDSVMGSTRRKNDDGTYAMNESGHHIYDRAVLQTIHLAPVYGNANDPKNENNQFWDASPSGQIELGTVNPAAASYFELGGEYYIDFTKAE